MKRTFFGLYLFIAIALFTSCSARETEQEIQYPVYIQIDLSEASAEQMLLSGIADEVSYIPLETVDSAILESAEYVTIKLTKDYIFVASNGEILKFSGTGEFIDKVAVKGRGPNEVARLYTFTVDDLEKRVYAFDRSGNKIMVFDYEGGYLGELDRFRELGYRDILQLGSFNSRMFASISQTPSTKDLAIWYDLSDGTISPLQPNMRQYTPEQVGNFNVIKPDNMGIQVCDTLLLYKEYFCDTVFSVNGDFNVSPRFIVDFGTDKYEWEQYREQMYNMNVRLPTYGYYVTNLAESKEQFFMTLSSASGDRVFIAHEKVGGGNKMQIVKYNPEDRRVKLENDLDGISDFIIQNSSSLNYFDGCMYTLIDAAEFKKSYDGAIEEEKTDPKYLKDLAPLLDGISEFDNPVLMRVTLK